jgi:hypothetical protein
MIKILISIKISPSSLLISLITFKILYFDLGLDMYLFSVFEIASLVNRQNINPSPVLIKLNPKLYL